MTTNAPQHCTCTYSRDAEGEHRSRDPECPVHGEQRKRETR